MDFVDAMKALEPFVTAYRKAADPIGDSDLYSEQPRSVHVTLGDCRKADRLYSEYERVGVIRFKP